MGGVRVTTLTLGRRLRLLGLLQTAARYEDEPPATWEEYVKLVKQYGVRAHVKSEELDQLGAMTVKSAFLDG